MFSILKIGGSLSGYLQDGDGHYMEFIADTKADIAALPTGKESGGGMEKPRPGSMTACIEDGSLYILSNDRVWVLFVEGSNAEPA